MNKNIKQFLICYLVVFMGLIVSYNFSKPTLSYDGIVDNVGAGSQTLYWTIDGSNCGSSSGNCILKITNEELIGSHYTKGSFNDSTNYQYSSIPWSYNGIKSVIVGEEGSIVTPSSTMAGWFKYLYYVTSFDFTYLDTSNVTNMSHMFYYCDSLKNIDLSSFNTSNVTNMSNMFYDCYDLENVNLSGWDTSNVTDMSNMFRYCSALKSLDLSNFNVSNLEHASDMFYECYGLESVNLSGWNLSNIRNISYMFEWCESLVNLNLENFKMSGEYDAYGMFYGCNNITELDLSGIDTTNLSEEYAFIQLPTSIINVKVSDKWTLELGTFSWKNTETSEVYDGGKIPTHVSATYKNVTKKYYYAVKNNVLRISNNEISGDYEDSFYDINYYYADNYPIYFEYKIDNIIVGNENDIIKPNYTSCWFAELYAENIDLTYLDTSNVKDMSYMFDYSPVKELDLSNFNTSNVKNMEGMFEGCGNLATIDVSNFDTSNVESMAFMFAGCFENCGATEPEYMDLYEEFGSKSKTSESHLENTRLESKNNNSNGINERVGSCNPQYGLTEIKGLENFDMTNVEYIQYMFAGDRFLEKLDLSSFDIHEKNCTLDEEKTNRSLQDCSNIFDENYSLNEIKVGPGWNSYLPEGEWKNKDTKVTYLGNRIPALTEATYVRNAIYWAIDNNTLKISGNEVKGNVASGILDDSIDLLELLEYGPPSDEMIFEIAPWLEYANTIKKVVVGGEGDIVKPKHIDIWFMNLENAKSIDVKYLDTSLVSSMLAVFSGCRSLESLDVSSWDVSNVEMFNSTFTYMNNLKYLDLSTWNTISARDMSGMFTGDYSLVYIDMDNFNTKNVENFSIMFAGCENLRKLDLTNFDLRNMDNMDAIFAECYKLGEVSLNEDNAYFFREQLPYPDSEYINGADEYWHNIDGYGYEPYEIPEVTDTYYAVMPISVEFDSDGGEEIPDMSKLLNNPLILPFKANKESVIESITTMFETNGGNRISKIETSKITNYNFKDFKDETSGLTYDLGDSYLTNEETTFKVDWETEGPLYETINLPVPEKEKSTFTGWSTTPDGKNIITGDYIANVDRTLYAVWGSAETETKYKFTKKTREQTISKDSKKYILESDKSLDTLVSLSINDHELEYDKDYVVGGNRIEFTLFGLEYLKSLDDGRYYVIAKYSDTNYESEAIINFESVVNPKTGDTNKLLYVFLLLSISVYALFVLRKESYNL